MSALSTNRPQQLAALFDAHDAQLLSAVGRRVAAQPATIADACSHAGRSCSRPSTSTSASHGRHWRG